MVEGLDENRVLILKAEVAQGVATPASPRVQTAEAVWPVSGE
jgi:hypothetical protein